MPLPPRKNRRSPIYRIECKVGMCNLYIPQLFKFHFGGAIHYRASYRNNSESWHWCVSLRIAHNFLQIILPYLRLKKAEAELAIDFQKRKMGKEYRGRKPLPEEEIVYREAQRILMKALKGRR